MENQISEFLEQINHEIEITEQLLNEAKEDLKNSIINYSSIDLHYGLAKYAEKVSIATAQLMTLKEQKRRFKFIFKTEEV